MATVLYQPWALLNVWEKILFLAVIFGVVLLVRVLSDKDFSPLDDD